MPNDPSAFGEAAQSDPTIETTVEAPDGEEYALIVRDASVSELEALEEREKNGDISGAEALDELIDEYLVEPDLDTDAVGIAWKKTAVSGILKAFDAGDDFIAEAMEAVETEGNRR